MGPETGRNYTGDENTSLIGLRITSQLASEIRNNPQDFWVLRDQKENLSVKFILGFFRGIGSYSLIDKGREVAHTLNNTLQAWKRFSLQRPEFEEFRQQIDEINPHFIAQTVTNGIDQLRHKKKTGHFTDDDPDNPTGQLASLMVYKYVTDIAAEIYPD